MLVFTAVKKIRLVIIRILHQRSKFLVSNVINDKRIVGKNNILIIGHIAPVN
jgi:hypothetical protein